MNCKHWIGLACLYLISLSANAVKPMIAAGAPSLFLNSDGSVWATGRTPDPQYLPGITSPVRQFQALADIVSVAGQGTEFALLVDGTLWGFGASNYGLLGNVAPQGNGQAQRILGLPPIRAFAANGDSIFALDQNGAVWAWGHNDHGQLGDGTQVDRSVPAQVTGLATVVAVAAGGSSALALLADGTVWMWGSAAMGSAGDGTQPGPGEAGFDHLLPTQVHVLDQVTAVSAGWGHHLALRSDGTVWTWGAGMLGQNGTGEAGLLDQMGQARVPVQVPGLDHVVAIDAKGFWFSLALKDDGTVWAWGNNNSGQLGVSGMNYSASPLQVPGLSGIVAISAGMDYVLAMRSDGAVFAWGGNSNGQLGDNGLQDRAQPGPVVGPGNMGQLNLLQPPPASINQLPSAQISLSVNSGTAPLTVQASANNATDPDGTLSAFNWKSSDGQQASGQSVRFVFAQPGTYTIDLLVVDNAGASGWTQTRVVVAPVQSAPVQATPKVGLAPDGAMALTNDGRILTWGRGSALGRYDATIASLKAYPLPAANGISGAVDFSGSHVLLADGSVLGWGANSNGQLGSGSQVSYAFQPQLISNLPPVQALASASPHGLALARDGRVFAWGGNAYGQLGLGDNIDRYQPVEVTGLADVASLAGGYNFSAALKTDGTVWAWGDNFFYQLGDGTQVASNRPIQVPGLAGISKIFAGAWALYAQKADGSMWATGLMGFTPVANTGGPNSGAYRVPDLDGALQIVGPGRNVLVLKTDGTVWTGGLENSLALGLPSAGNFLGLKQIPGISDAIGVAGSGWGSMALRRDGTVLAWGLNDNGQIGDGTLAQRPTPVLVVNETGDGYLDLIPGIDFELPPNVGVPFFAVASGSVADVSASVSTKAKFNTPDVGKAGSVFVTAAVPSGSLVAVSSPMSAAGTYGASAVAGSSSFVLINLTASGWQSVTNGQLTPYATGVLGDQLSAQTILDNTDTTNLKGAQFCLGYGTSVDQMLASGTMRVIASIPDPNASGAAAASCIIAGSDVSYSFALPQGWSLLGNSLAQSLAVATLFSDTSAITSVWKWDAASMGWQFYTPQMTATELQAYAAGKGYAVLATINPGEGYWVNAKAQPAIAAQSGASFILTSPNLTKGWNLVATGNDITPAQFNTNLKSSLPGTGVTTLWAWDNPQGAWYFYAPSLEAQGGTALSGYIANKGYLDFSTTNKKLGNGTGFWVNR